MKAWNGFQDKIWDILRKGIKTIQTVYYQELAKALKQKESGAGTEDLYKSKLSWYQKADSFLLNTLTATWSFSLTLLIKIFNFLTEYVSHKKVKNF